MGTDGTAKLELSPIEDYKIEGTEILNIILISSSLGDMHWYDVGVK